MRRRISTHAVSGIISLLAGACAPSPEVSGVGEKTMALNVDPAAPKVSVMSRNLYVGADVDTAIVALATPDPNDDLPTIISAVQTFMITDFSARAGAIAAEIERTRPDVIGLQEVWYVNIDIPGLATVEVDFLTELQAAIADLGLNYAVATHLPTTGAVLPGVTLLDADTILVNTDRVTVQYAAGELFQANLGDPGAGFEIVRGWTMVNASVGGQPMQFLNAHLESGDNPLIAGLRSLQAMELASMARTDVPVVLVGDLNDGPGSAMHQVLTAAGFVDGWPALRGAADGDTCCHVGDLNAAVDTNFDQRIDYVFARGFADSKKPLRGWITRLGRLPWETVPGPVHDLWPSDHYGVAAWLIYP